jgi:hypothetical protein
MFTVTTYENNPPEDVTCVDEGNDVRSNSISLKRGLVPQDNCTIIILHWVVTVYGAHAVCVGLKHLKTKLARELMTRKRVVLERSVYSSFNHLTRLIAPEKSYGVQRNVPVSHT